MKPVVVLRGVKKTYRDREVETPALRGVDLVIEPGEFTAVAGPSGSGKTTLLNIIGALDKPDEGEVWVDGVNLGELKPKELAEFRLQKVGFVFQAYNLIEVFNALENAEFVLFLQGVPKAERRRRAAEVLKALGITEEMFKKRPNQLSGGQQQRVAVARALAPSPSIILADEPTANLDSEASARLLKLMRQMNERYGATFLFATHDPLVMRYAKRVVHLSDGRVVKDERR